VRTSRDLLRGAGRVVLWGLVLLLLLRGIGDVLGSEAPVSVARDSRPAAAVWPDDEARAFAQDFARAYLSYSPRRPGRYARRLERFAGPELAAAMVPDFAQRGSRQVVQALSTARVARLGDRQALITVAASLALEDGGTTRLLTVPVARDARGGLAVFDLPSFAAPTSRAEVDAVRSEPLTGVARAQIEDVLERFFAAYLAGDSAELEYLTPAGVRLAALEAPHELAGLGSLAQVAGREGRTRLVLVTVRARDVQTRAVYGLRYRVRLVRGDRWYVAAVNTTQQGE
jgi:hypothetical protein